MDFFAPIFNFIIDSSKKLSYRAVTILLIILIILLVDNLVGFSYYYNLEKKIEIVNNLNKALKDSSITSSDKVLINKLREDVIFHKSLKDKLWDFLANNNNYIWHKGVSLESISQIFLWITAASAGLTGMAVILIVAVPLLFKNKKQSLDEDNLTIFIKIIGTEFIFYVLAISEANLLLRIPIIFGSIFFNYFFNLVVNLLLLYLLIKLIPSTPKTVNSTPTNKP